MGNNSLISTDNVAWACSWAVTFIYCWDAECVEMCLGTISWCDVEKQGNVCFTEGEIFSWHNFYCCVTTIQKYTNCFDFISSHFLVCYTTAYGGSSISYIMHIKRLSSKYFYRTCDMHVLFQINKCAETCRWMFCVKDAIIEVIFKCNLPFLRSVSHTMGYSTPKTLFSLPCVLTLFRLATGWAVRGSNLDEGDFFLPV